MRTATDTNTKGDGPPKLSEFSFTRNSREELIQWCDVFFNSGQERIADLKRCPDPFKAVWLCNWVTFSFLPYIHEREDLRDQLARFSDFFISNCSIIKSSLFKVEDPNWTEDKITKAQGRMFYRALEGRYAVPFFDVKETLSDYTEHRQRGFKGVRESLHKILLRQKAYCISGDRTGELYDKFLAPVFSIKADDESNPRTFSIDSNDGYVKNLEIFPLTGMERIYYDQKSNKMVRVKNTIEFERDDIAKILHLYRSKVSSMGLEKYAEVFECKDGKIPGSHHCSNGDEPLTVDLFPLGKHTSDGRKLLMSDEHFRRASVLIHEVIRSMKVDCEEQGMQVELFRGGVSTIDVRTTAKGKVIQDKMIEYPSTAYPFFIGDKFGHYENDESVLDIPDVLAFDVAGKDHTLAHPHSNLTILDPKAASGVTAEWMGYFSAAASIYDLMHSDC